MESELHQSASAALADSPGLRMVVVGAAAGCQRAAATSATLAVSWIDTSRTALADHGEALAAADVLWYCQSGGAAPELAFLRLARLAAWMVTPLLVLEWRAAGCAAAEQQQAFGTLMRGNDQTRAVLLDAGTGEDPPARIAAALRPGERGDQPLAAALSCLGQATGRDRLPFRMLVDAFDAAQGATQWLQGRVVSGRLALGDPLRLLPAGATAAVVAIHDATGLRCASAAAGATVRLELDQPLPVAGLALACAGAQPAALADRFEAGVLWLGPAPLLRGRSYGIRIAGQTGEATVSPIKYRLDPASDTRHAAESLDSGALGVVELELRRPVAFDPAAELPATGLMLLFDPDDGHCCGMACLQFALRRAQNVHMYALAVSQQQRSLLKRQQPCVIWYTGLSGAGKSSIANAVDRRLAALGYHSYVLDGDNVRHGLNKDLGFTDADRVENIRRIAEVARLMVDAGLIVGTAFISPFLAERRMARSLLPDGQFIEVHVDVPLAVAEQRDPKGLYRKARSGQLSNFTGIDSAYEPPEAPEIHIRSAEVDLESAADQILAYLAAHGRLAIEAPAPAVAAAGAGSRHAVLSRADGSVSGEEPS